MPSDPPLPRAPTSWETRKTTSTLSLSDEPFAYVTYTPHHGWDLYLVVTGAYSAHGPWGHTADARQKAMDAAETYARAWVQACAQTDDHRARVSALQEITVRRLRPAWLPVPRSTD